MVPKITTCGLYKRLCRDWERMKEAEEKGQLSDPERLRMDGVRDRLAEHRLECDRDHSERITS